MAHILFVLDSRVSEHARRQMLKTSCVISHLNELVFVNGRRIEATPDFSYQICLHVYVTAGLLLPVRLSRGRDTTHREARTSWHGSPDLPHRKRGNAVCPAQTARKGQASPVDPDFTQISCGDQRSQPPCSTRLSQCDPL